MVEVGICLRGLRCSGIRNGDEKDRGSRPVKASMFSESIELHDEQLHPRSNNLVVEFHVTLY